jgi:hypothetical protein
VSVDISALLLACSVHADDALLLSIAYVQGRGDPYAVIDTSLRAIERDDALGVDKLASSPTAARASLTRIVALGGEPVLGLLPVRPEWATEFGKTLDDLFDPCSDIAVASAKLSEFEHACRRVRQRRGCILDLYGRSLGLPALRRAVLADLTLSSPFPDHGSDTSEALAGQSGSDLFFAITPVAPMPALPAIFSSLPPGEGP